MNIFRTTVLAAMRSRPKFSSFFLLAVAVCMLVVIGGLLLFSVSELPQEPLREHIKTARAEGYFADNYPKMGFLTVLGKRPDMYTECIGIGVASTLRPEAESLLSMSFFGECEGLTKAVDDNFATQPTPYMRYLHGSQVFLKPLYTFFYIDLVRLIACGMTVSLLALLFVTLRSSLNTAYAAIVVFSLFITRSYSPFLLVTHAAQFWLVLAGAVCVVRFRHRVSPLLLFGVIGACDTFFSFLNMGGLSLGLPLLCYGLVLWRDDKAPEEIVAAMFWGGIGWSMGFVMPWLLKWAILDWTLQPTREQLFGATLDAYPTRNVWMIGTALCNNLRALQWHLCLVICALLFVRKRRLHLTIPSGLWAALLPAFVPVVWVCILPGQSGIKHSSFVNLIFWPSVAALFLLLAAVPRKR